MFWWAFVGFPKACLMRAQLRWAEMWLGRMCGPSRIGPLYCNQAIQSFGPVAIGKGETAKPALRRRRRRRRRRGPRDTPISSEATEIHLFSPLTIQRLNQAANRSARRRVMQGVRVNLKGWQQAAVAFGSAFGTLLRRADLIAALGETTGKPAFHRVLQRMRNSAEGK
uniref:Uncharacterized protein n=1 Tax=Oryza punctata TaxID=4537 RepID=A0A0E0KZD8_ORYPU